MLQKEGAVTAEQMRQCKQRMNTFAYIGSVRDKPVVRCVYQTDITGNKFLARGAAGAMADDAVGSPRKPISSEAGPQPAAGAWVCSNGWRRGLSGLANTGSTSLRKASAAREQ